MLGASSGISGGVILIAAAVPLHLVAPCLEGGPGSRRAVSGTAFPFDSLSERPQEDGGCPPGGGRGAIARMMNRPLMTRRAARQTPDTNEKIPARLRSVEGHVRAVIQGAWIGGLAALALVGCVDGALPKHAANDPADPNAAEARSVVAPTVSTPGDPEASIPRSDHTHTHGSADAAASP
jgi:hypothetical protein